MLEETVIAFLYQESGLHMEKILFYFKGMQIWNSMNASIYTAATLEQFKHLYKSHFSCMYVNVYVIIFYVMYGHC